MLGQLGIELELPVLREGTPVTLPHIEHTKDNPLNYNGNLLHKDASMLEMAMRPCRTAAELIDAYRESLSKSRKMIGKGMTFSFDAALEYSDTELSRDEYANVMGCSPSECIYPEGGVTPEAYADNYRYAGMHLNFEHGCVSDQEAIARVDATIGLYSVVMYEQEQKDAIVRRRQCYGRAGEYRSKDGYVEYRTLPVCAWSEGRAQHLISMLNYALTADIMPAIIDHYVAPYAVMQAINECDAEAADHIFTTIHGRSCGHFNV